MISAAEQGAGAGPTAKDMLNAAPLAFLLLDAGNHVLFANAAAESLFGLGEDSLQRSKLSALFGEDEAVAALIGRIRRGSGVVVAREMAMKGPLAGLIVDLQAAQVADHDGHVLLLIEERRLPSVFRGQALVEGAIRSAYGLAGMLAHEIKNPLSGIRGAAQILEKTTEERGRAMAVLIRDEVDRIRRLLDQLETFTDSRPFDLKPVNIHTVLNHVRDVAGTGFAAGYVIEEHYDPSLPPVLGNRDSLVQIFLNLVKNAVEASGRDGGEIRLQTAYRHGLRLPQGEGGPVDLPIEITVSDNGPGVAPLLAEHIFDPFVTGREGGSGLGLAMVAKLVAGHGGLIELSNSPTGASFRILLPAAKGGESDD